ncbi:uncharacterized protein LOC119550540 [Drosophila subpulchrella]|uniref:uncharacterized protein LOC119550540 n=1 Tax=Drosophila subpulchrella TaxID=1486046 RepID=UPI0018A16F48|nr:uncharacterized protein LOC119550540 [Drosophila subpulchrella]
MFSNESSRTLPPQPPKCPCHLPDRQDCGEQNKEMHLKYRQLDIEDVTDSVMKVMRICGLRPWEVKRSAGVIKRSLQHYEEVVQRIDRIPRKRFAKESFLHGMAYEAQISRMDAQMAYAIVKRAFKAFYHGTGMGGRRYFCLQDKVTHVSECLWLHAARRTAQIHAALAGLMHSEELLFEERIECVYKNLYDVLQTRVLWADNVTCICGQGTAPQSHVVSNTGSSQTTQMEVLYARHKMGASSAPSKTSTRAGTQKPSAAVSAASSRHNHILRRGDQTMSNKRTPVSGSSTTSASQPKCNCPHLRCCREYGEARESPEITAECSQGPYICRWLPFTEEDEEFPEHRVPFPPLEVVCPPCPKEDLSCDSECTCTCQVCTCRPAFDDGAGEQEEQMGEKLSKTGLEDQDTDFCYVGPFRGSSVERMARLKEREKLLEVEEELEEVEEEQDIQCGCTCEYKQHAYPHLFTYLTPFKIKKEAEEEPQPKVEKVNLVEESESEDLLSKPPPCGVSLDTYRCWVKPTSSSHSSQQTKPPLVVVLGEKAKPKFQITIKEQHHSNQKASAPPAPPLPKAPVLPNKPAPTPAPAKPPVAPQKAEEKDEKLTKEDILDIIGLRFR